MGVSLDKLMLILLYHKFQFNKNLPESLKFVAQLTNGLNKMFMIGSTKVKATSLLVSEHVCVTLFQALLVYFRDFGGMLKYPHFSMYKYTIFYLMFQTYIINKVLNCHFERTWSYLTFTSGSRTHLEETNQLDLLLDYCPRSRKRNECWICYADMGILTNLNIMICLDVKTKREKIKWKERK